MNREDDPLTWKECVAIALPILFLFVLFLML